MAIKEVPGYQAVCDGCGYVFDNDECSFWMDRESALVTAECSGADVRGEHVLCSECVYKREEAQEGETG